MRFVQRDGVWLLLGDGDGVLAVLRDEVEIAVLRRLCELRLAGEGGGFEIIHADRSYRVEPTVGEGGRLTLDIQGGGEPPRRIETGFVV